MNILVSHGSSAKTFTSKIRIHCICPKIVGESKKFTVSTTPNGFMQKNHQANPELFCRV